MARYRPPEYCPKCNKQLQAIHNDRGSHFVGDTFVGYKECDCAGEQQPVTGELYWKQRCFAAEMYINELPYKGTNNFRKWQQLKNQEVEPQQNQDELWEELVRMVEDRQFRQIKYPVVYKELSSNYLLIKK